MEAELREAQAASSKAAAATAAAASALEAATAGRDAAQRTASDAERSAAAARQQAEAAQAKAAALQSQVEAAEAAAVQLREEAAELRAQQDAEARRAAELQRGLEVAAAQQAAAEQSFKEQAVTLELQAMEAAAAAAAEQEIVMDVLRRRKERRQRECDRLRAALAQEQGKGFWARLFGGGKAKVAPEQEGWASDAAEAAPPPVGQPAAGDSWRSPRSQAPPFAPSGVPAADGAAAAAAEGGVPDQPTMPAWAPAEPSTAAGNEGELEQSVCEEQQGAAAPGEEVEGTGRLGSGSATKGGPASAPALHPDDPAAATSLKAQAAAAAGVVGASPEAARSDSMGDWEAPAGGAAAAGEGANMGGWEAAAGGEGGSIPAFRPVSQQLEVALQALLES